MKEVEQQLRDKIYTILILNDFGTCESREKVAKEIVEMLKAEQVHYFPMEPDLSEEDEMPHIKRKTLEFAKFFEEKFNCKIHHIFLKSEQNYFCEVMYAVPKYIVMNEKIYADTETGTGFDISFISIENLNFEAVQADDFYEYINDKWVKEFSSLHSQHNSL